jgi:peptide chain release factor 1
VDELLSAYLKYAKSFDFITEVLDHSFGHVLLKVCGVGAARAFKWETGQHVCQRIPITEHKGRKQTSVISVTVLPLPPEKAIKPIPQNELEIICQRGHGKGGQNVNKVSSAVRICHIPTGLKVFINGRDQYKNKCLAIRILTTRVNDFLNNKRQEEYDNHKKSNMSDGGRGSKIRTYNFLRGKVVDHRLGTKTSNINQIMKGDFNLILKQGLQDATNEV